MKKCPFCAEEIQDEAIKCRYCGSTLDRANKFGGQAPEADDADVRQLLSNGKKIEAIKLVREKTNAGLKEAKDYVESLERGGAARMPVRAPGSTEQKTGNPFVAIFLVLVVLLAIAWMSGLFGK